MPELPETETIARDLDRRVRGSVIDSVRVPKADVLRLATPATLAKRLRGATIERVWRRAKLVVLDLSTGDRLVVQPRFTGALLVDDGSLAEDQRDYITVEMGLRDGRRLLYRDVRRLGTVALMSESQWRDYDAKLGVEPLDPGFSDSSLSGILRGTRRPIKQALMDQRLVAGIGNIYATEALWMAALDPSRPADALAPDEVLRLRDSIVEVLTDAVKYRGTSFRDYRDSSGERGGFQHRLRAYGRAGEPCVRCGRPLVGTHAIDGRATVFCFHCQR